MQACCTMYCVLCIVQQACHIAVCHIVCHIAAAYVCNRIVLPRDIVGVRELITKEERRHGHGQWAPRQRVSTWSWVSDVYWQNMVFLISWVPTWSRFISIKSRPQTLSHTLTLSPSARLNLLPGNQAFSLLKLTNFLWWGGGDTFYYTSHVMKRFIPHVVCEWPQNVAVSFPGLKGLRASGM